MNRRRVLTTIGAVCSLTGGGCLNRGEILLKDSTQRTVAVTNSGDVGEAHPFRLNVSRQPQTMGANATPELAIYLESTAEEDQFLSYTDAWPEDGVFRNRNSDPAGLRLLAETEAFDGTIEKGRCPSTEYLPTDSGDTSGHRISPGEQERVGYAVVVGAQDLDVVCPPTGRYRFRSTYAYAGATAVERHGWEATDRTRFTWGFTVVVSDTP